MISSLNRQWKSLTNQVRIIEVAEDELTDSHASDYSVRKQCTPGVCLEKANYPGDPGGYHKKHIGVGSRNKCRQICDRDPHCCHWVHYGRHRGHITQFRLYFYFFIQLKQRGKDGAPSLVSWRRRSLALFRETPDRSITALSLLDLSAVRRLHSAQTDSLSVCWRSHLPCIEKYFLTNYFVLIYNIYHYFNCVF